MTLTGCFPAGTKSSDYESIDLVQLQKPKEGQDMAVITTPYGTISFVLYTEHAPNTVAQFKALVEKGYYTNNAFWGVNTESSSILGGASDAEGKTGEICTPDNKPVVSEASMDLWHFTGAVSAYGDEKGLFTKTIQADSRFFIMGTKEPLIEIAEQMESNDYPTEVIEAYKTLGGFPLFTGSFTVFGQVVDGLDVVDTILKQPVKKSTIYPEEEILIEKIELTTYTSEKDAN